MTDIESLYRKADGKVLIEIKLSTVMQLFNSFDPSPFHEKELDIEAERYIVDAIRDFPKNTEFKIVIHLPREFVQGEQAKTIPAAIHNHFQYRALVMMRKYRERLKYGRMSLLIGLCFLFINLIVRQIVLNWPESPVNNLIAEALLIFGWVAMWTPISVLLYELWPLIRIENIFQKVSEMEIEVLPS